MYFKKLLLLVSLLGLLIAGIVSYNIYGIIFHPNTSFNQDHVMVRVSKDAVPEDIYKTMTPFLENPESFIILAQKKALSKNVKPGLYKIEKGMSNNEIIDVLILNNR